MMKMKTLSILVISAASVFAMSACTTQQTNKPPPGTGQVGPLSGDDMNTHSHGGNVHSHQGGNIPGHSHNADGSMINGAGSTGSGGSASGSGNGGSAAGGNSGSGQAGQYGQYGNGAGGGGTGTGSGQGQYGQGAGFGSGGAYSGNTKSSYTPADLRDPRSILAQRTIYFDYDQSTIKAEYRRILDAHASLLVDFPQLNVRLEGHADERGSREYNVALSERRGYSVLDYLKIKGVKASQADVVGYGEEIPATFGHGEGSWSKNRRVEIIYAGE